jgi:hypothetical protein
VARQDATRRKALVHLSRLRSEDGLTATLDLRRWLLVEAWLALGLRMSWATYYDRERHEWIDANSGRYKYRYVGGKEWEILEPDPYRRPGTNRNDVPVLETDDLRHELAHYLSATPEDREKPNFGIAKKDLNDERENKALEAEAVIDALLVGARRIAEMGLRP